jgi:SprT protein
MITIVETPEDMQALMKECIQITYDFIDGFNKKFGLYLPKYKVVFSLKTGTAGRARLSQGIIQYNPTLLRENPEAFLKRTTGHEVGHFAAYHKFHDCGHGKHWHRMMREMGLDDTRCHSYDTSNVPSKVGRVPNKRNNLPVPSEHGVIKTFGIGKIVEFD